VSAWTPVPLWAALVCALALGVLGFGAGIETERFARRSPAAPPQSGCASRYMLSWSFTADPPGSSRITLLVCEAPAGHRGKHSAQVHHMGGIARGAAWTDAESLDGPEPLPIPDNIRRAFDDGGTR
jgi:hypothetical protein